jgi:hypothetical protein
MQPAAPPMTAPRTGWWPGRTLLARYDTGVLRPPAVPEGAGAAGPKGLALTPHQEQVQRWILAWCRHGAGDGRLPLLRPWAAPLMDEPLKVAVLVGPPGPATAAPVTDLALRLDGTWTMLAAGGPWARRLLRLSVKRDECCWWRARSVDAPWDSGELGESPAALARLAHFQPRRPTLVVARGLADPALAPAVQVLTERQRSFRHAVRLLVVDTRMPAALAHWTADTPLVGRSGRVSWHRLIPPAAATGA